MPESCPRRTVEWVKLEFQPWSYRGKIVSMAHYSMVKKKKISGKKETKACQVIIRFQKKLAVSHPHLF